MPGISEEELLRWRDAAASESLRRDFATMRENVRRSTRKMTVDDVISFLTGASRAFNHPQPARRLADTYTRMFI